MKRLAAFDEAMMAACEVGYLWLYDRTGVWLGTVASGLLALSTVAERLAGGPLDLFALFLYGAFGLILVAAQKWIPHRLWNAMVEKGRRLALRRAAWLLLILMSAVLTVLRAATGLGPLALLGLCLPVAMYLMLVRFRERRPPPRRALSGAFGGMAADPHGQAG